MLPATIPMPDLLPTIGPSQDAAYDVEGAGAGVMFRFRQDPLGLKVGCVLPSGERFGYQFVGFVPTARTLVGSAIAVRQGTATSGTTMTFKVINGMVKERIRWASPADAQTRMTVTLLTQGCHFEGGPAGSLVVWSDLTGAQLATVPPPTIADRNGRSDGAIRYELAADGHSVDLVTDGAWLAAAVFPVFIDPTTISSSGNLAVPALDTSTGGHMFRMSDGTLVALWKGTDDALYRSTSADGLTWTSPASVFPSFSTNRNFVVAVQVGDTIYGATTYQYNKLRAFKMVYASSAFTDSDANLAFTSIGAPSAFNSAQIVYDSVKTTLHIVADASGNVLVCAVSTGLGLTKDVAITGTINPTSVAIAVDGAGSPNVYAAHQTASGVGLVQPYTWNGTTYTAGSVETAIASGLVVNALSCALDQSSLLDLFWVDSGALKTRKRTGVNTYGSVTTIIASGVYQGPNTAVSRTGNGNADLFVVYRYTANQANGEIYYVKRTAGVWGLGTLIAGGASTAWDRPTAIFTVQADNKVHVLYLTGNVTALVYDGSLTTGTTPSAPINVLPAGNANTSTTPTCSATYKNTQASDNLGKYRVLVTRQSDSVVFWDTGSTGTAYGGSSITDGGTFSIAYAGTALVKGTVYLVQFQFWDALTSSAGPLSTAVAFSVNDAPAIAITSSSTPSSSGPTVTWTYSQAQSHAQASYQIVVTRAGVTVYDSGVVASAALSAALPGGTLTNHVAHVITLTVLSTDGL